MPDDVISYYELDKMSERHEVVTNTRKMGARDPMVMGILEIIKREVDVPEGIQGFTLTARINEGCHITYETIATRKADQCQQHPSG